VAEVHLLHSDSFSIDSFSSQKGFSENVLKASLIIITVSNYKQITSEAKS